MSERKIDLVAASRAQYEQEGYGRLRSDGPSGGRSGQHRAQKPRHKVNPFWLFIQIIGELVLTAGLIAMLYVAWQLFYTDYTANKVQAQVVKDISKDFKAPTTSSGDGNDMSSFGDPVIGAKPTSNMEKFGIVYIPRFGADFSRPLIQGTGSDVLDELGIGHYPSSQMPGEVGNFAVAGHRNTSGSVLNLIGDFEPGDHIYVQTKDGYYQYTYRNTMYVHPDRADVIDPVPTMPGATPTDRFMTLTSCHPRYTDHERVIAYAVYSGWRPLSAGPPAEISKVVAENQGS